jgi:putative FmdB family regulatory protein
VPLYEYQCQTCGRFEVIRKFSDPPLVVCPTCGGEVQKLFSAPAIQFKGTGWYITDYARKSAGADGDKGAKKDGAEGDKGAKKEGAEGDQGAKKDVKKSEAGTSSEPASSTPTQPTSKDNAASGSSPTK